jgi:hypothetical protein
MKIVFHIGLHKTGSTFLQREIFPQIFREENYLYKKCAQKVLRQRFFSSNRINFLSEENWSNSIKKPQIGWSNFEEFIQQINTFKKAEIKIIIILRKHADWLWSAYLHELKMNRKRSISLEDYAYSFGNKGLSWFNRISWLDNFETMTINYSDLLNDSLSVILKIANFSEVEISEDVSFSQKLKCNLTPKTKPAMVASQSFEKVYKVINDPAKRIFGNNLISDSYREFLRDSLISTSSFATFNSLSIKRPILPKNLLNKFAEDWDMTWNYVNKNGKK